MSGEAEAYPANWRHATIHLNLDMGEMHSDGDHSVREWIQARLRPSLRLASSAMGQNKAGEWVPAIPLPFFGFRKRCSCGAKFWTTRGYRGHYALAHVLKLEDR